MSNDGYHLSPSQINSYMSCPLRYRFNYRDKLAPEFISLALVFGGSMHRCFSAYCEGAHHISDLMSIFKREWEMSLNRGPLIRFGKTDSPAKQEALAERMLLALMKEWKPQGISDVDLEVEGVIAGFDVIGILDAIADGKIIEFKTSSRVGGGDHTLQVGTYSLLTGISAVTVVELTKTASPVVSITEFNGKLLWKRIEMIYQAVGNAIGEGRYYPCPGWMCAACGHSGACEKWD